MKRTHVTHSIFEQLFPPKLSKSDHTKMQILEAAIQTYATLGVDYVSYEDVARRAELSRPLIQHYFPDKRGLFQLAIKLIRAHLQELSIHHMSGAHTAKDRFVKYVESHFLWARDHPTHANAWLFFFLACASDPDLKKQNSEMSEIARQRIGALLAAGQGSEDFAPGNLEEKARIIHELISGALIELETERPRTALEEIERKTVAACLLIAGSK